MTATADREQASYLGHPLIITKTGITVHRPDGRRLATFRSPARARLYIRTLRHLNNQETR